MAPLTGLPPGTKATGVDAGADFSVVLDKTGKVHGAGRNTDRQLTLATTSDVTTLTPFAAMPSGYVATAVAAGATSMSVLLNDGRIVSTAPGTARPIPA
ncbi:RCC1-like domain-containing protein [Aeromicrobium sp. UC242_57]|uniref:RCC1-like domain-containing protein n=1 Tax=Aeromicrobium sp. UC242_57 TaxID=3374624 RepID=UPI0037AB5AE0